VKEKAVGKKKKKKKKKKTEQTVPLISGAQMERHYRNDKKDRSAEFMRLEV